MKLNSRLTRLSLVMAALLSTAAIAEEQVIEWDADNAILGGSGCKKDENAWALAAGNDLSIIFSSLGVDLSGDLNTKLAELKKCSARVRARVEPGRYIGTLRQTLTYGLIKTRRAKSTIGVNSSFAGYPLQPLNHHYGENVVKNGELEVATREDDFSVYTRRWCSGAIPVTYAAQLSVAGERRSKRESVVTQIDGLDVRFELTAGSVLDCRIGPAF